MAVEPSSILETDDGVRYMEPNREAAWLALLRTHSDLTRALDSALHAHGLTLSAYEALSRLARAQDGYLRMSELAVSCGLSPSRISRLIDDFSRRGWVARQSCPGDSRVVYAVMTAAGREQFAQAQETFFVVMQERFLGRLDCSEVAQLSDLLAKLAD